MDKLISLLVYKFIPTSRDEARNASLVDKFSPTRRIRVYGLGGGFRKLD